ncbi:hypothetical protein RIF29_16600 [Crotalaria pallida]|uniref:Uncharacterized protein n=1 Tax=Crotalaria pallida TaxID=3830 RepID=A0AAN9FHM5_CROPI
MLPRDGGSMHRILKSTPHVSCDQNVVVPFADSFVMLHFHSSKQSLDLGLAQSPLPHRPCCQEFIMDMNEYLKSFSSPWPVATIGSADYIEVFPLVKFPMSPIAAATAKQASVVTNTKATPISKGLRRSERGEHTRRRIEDAKKLNNINPKRGLLWLLQPVMHRAMSCWKPGLSDTVPPLVL